MYMNYTKRIINTKSCNRDLLILYKLNGDLNARDALIINNENLVKKLANYMSSICSLDFEDLVQEGFIGLIKGIEKFNLEMDTQFSTYVYYWIKQNMSRAIYDKGFMVRLPIHLVEKINKLLRLERYHLLNYKKIDISKICSSLDISIEEYNNLKFYILNYKSIYSLNKFINEDDSFNTELLNFIPMSSNLFYHDENDNMDVENKFVNDSLRKEIQSMLSTLPHRDEFILRERFGIFDKQPKTLEQIGFHFNVTRERIRQIESKALKRLRNTNKNLKDYLND